MRGSKFSLDFKFSLLSFLSRMLLSSIYFLKKVKYFTCQSLNRHMEFFPKEFWLSSSAVDMGLWLYLSLIDQSTISAFFLFSLFQVQPLSLSHTHTHAHCAVISIFCFVLHKMDGSYTYLVMA